MCYSPPSLFSFACTKLVDIYDGGDYRLCNTVVNEILETYHEFDYVKRCDFCALLYTGISPMEYHRNDLEDMFPSPALNICNGCIGEHFEVLKNPYDSSSDESGSDTDSSTDEDRDESNITLKYMQMTQWEEDNGITIPVLSARDKVPGYGETPLFLWRLFGRDP